MFTRGVNMSLFKKLFKKSSTEEEKKRVVVIGLDGTPFSFVKRMMDQGHMPNFAAMIENGDFRQMKSVYPTISSVAWSTFMTGVNPAKHGIFGFVDLVAGSYEMTIPTARDMKAETLWQFLSRHGKRVVVMNVPLTYPPKEVNGILISGFLATDLAKATYPPKLAEFLKEMGYRIDVDSQVARKSKERLLEDVNRTFKKRVEVMFHFLEKEKWDYLHTHIMCTDRLFHFLWREMEKKDENYYAPFIEFINKIDEMLGKLEERLDENTELIVLSDHGFCEVKANVQLNHWLYTEGYLKYKNEKPKGLADISSESVAFSLIPGRIFIHTQGKWPKGSVRREDYESVREEIKEKLMKLRHPETGEKIIDRVFKKEEIYHGPYFERAADLIAHPVDGYDIKGKLWSDSLLTSDVINGMHTYNDAFLYIKKRKIKEVDLEIMDVNPTIMKMFGIEVPENIDGRAVI